MTTKTFDAVDMKRNAAKAIYEEIKDMTMAEQLAYWKKHELALTRRQHALKKKSVTSAGRPKRTTTRKPKDG